MDHTIKVLNKIRDDYASHPAVSAIELLNEPMGPSLNMDTVRQFYMDGWGNLKDSDVAVTFHDAFEGVTAWGSWGSGMWNLLLDTHHYEIFDNSQVSQDIGAHIGMACDFGNQMASTGKNTIAGEWTGGITDCAKWLNGKNKGARYDGTYNGASATGSCAGKSSGSVAALSSADKSNIGKFIEAQLDAYEKASGWIFWTWKTEGAPEWDMQDLLANGLFPQPLTSRKCKSYCAAEDWWSERVANGSQIPASAAKHPPGLQAHRMLADELGVASQLYHHTLRSSPFTLALLMWPPLLFFPSHSVPFTPSNDSTNLLRGYPVALASGAPSYSGPGDYPDPLSSALLFAPHCRMLEPQFICTKIFQAVKRRSEHSPFLL